MESICVYCPACHWSYNIPVHLSIENTPINDYRRVGDEYLERHMHNDHGLMSTLKHEYELSEAIRKATREGERRGRLEIQDQMKIAVKEAIREAIENIRMED